MKIPVVAFPGTLCSPAIFKPTADALADTCDFHAISWMMHEPEGCAPPKDGQIWSIPEISRRQARNIKQPVILLGHSIGGAIAACVAAENQDVVRALILVNTGAHMRRHGDVNKIIQAMQSSGGKNRDDDNNDDNDNDVRARVIARSFAKPPPAETLAELTSYAASVPSQAVLQVLQSQRDLDLTPLLVRIRCPTVVVHGVLDGARSREDAEELAGLVPGGAVVRWVECGHTPVFEAAEAVAGVMREVIERLE